MGLVCLLLIIEILVFAVFEDFLRPVLHQPRMEIVKTRKFGVRSKIFLFSKTMQDYGNSSGDNQGEGRRGILSTCEILLTD